MYSTAGLSMAPVGGNYMGASPPSFDRGGYGGGFGGSSYGGGYGGSYGAKPDDRMSSLGASLKDLVYTSSMMKPFQRNFYIEEPHVRERDPQRVEQWRRSKEISIIAGPRLNPLEEFTDYKWPDYINQGIRQCGFVAPMAIQAQVWPVGLSGYDMIAIAATGSGKTLGFLFPGLIHIMAQERCMTGDGPIVLCMAPTRELALQIEGEAERFGRLAGIRCVCVYGGAPKPPQSAALKRGAELVIATPGRLIDFLESGATNLRRCTYLVLDEADRMLDMGFEPQIRKVVGQIRPDRQTLLFSATWPKEVRQLAHDFLQPGFCHVNVGLVDLSANKDIQQHIIVIEEAHKFDFVIRLFTQLIPRTMKSLVFTNSKRECDHLSETLKERGFHAVALHGDKEQRAREHIMGNFRTGRTMILVATDVASRGLDIRDIAVVINYDFPAQMEDYIHRIGRTGRAGARGTAYSLFTAKDARLARELIKVLEEAGQVVDEKLRYMASNAASFKSASSKGGYRGGGGRPSTSRFGRKF